MAWTDAVITNSGLALLAEIINGHTLTIKSAVVGGGTVQASSLMAQTDITEKIDVPTAIASVSDFSAGDGKLIRLQIRNTNVVSSYTMKQIGLFASLDGGENVLFAIMQDEVGENIPTEKEYPDFLIEFSAAVALSQTDDINVEISGSSVVTAEMLDNAIEAIKEYSDTADSATLAAAKSYSAPLNHTHTTSDITNFPTSLPANGGDADTVNGHTVNSDVPANAKYTDTVYTHPAYTARTGVPTANQTPAFGGSFAVTQPVSDSTGHITAMTSRTITIPSTAASASAAGLVTTGAQTLAGNKTFSGQLIPAGASDTATPQARKIYAGTTDLTAGVSTLETGTIYLVYE